MLRPHFILASASPRRLQLLQQVGLKPDAVIPANIDETPQKHELPLAYVRRMALQKAQAVAIQEPKSVVLAADTIVAVGRRILPKAEDEVVARACLTLLSGRRHRVYTAICIAHAGQQHTAEEMTTVKFDQLVNKDIEAYLASGQWQGKAGGYAIQGQAERFIPWINGSFSNVVGLPLRKTCHMLAASGVT